MIFITGSMMIQEKTETPPFVHPIRKKKDFSYLLLLFLLLFLAISSILNIIIFRNKNEAVHSRNMEILKMDSLNAVKLIIEKERDYSQIYLDQKDAEIRALQTLLEINDIKLKEAGIFNRKLIYEMNQLEAYPILYENALVQNRDMDNQINDLLKAKEVLLSEKTYLDHGYKVLKEENEKLLNFVKENSFLHIQSFIIEPLYKRDKKTVLTYSSKKANYINIKLTLSGNSFFKSDFLQVYVRITKPDGSILVETGGDYNFKSENDIVFTQQTQIRMYVQPMDVNFILEKKGRWMSGRYKVEIFCEGHMIGSSQFALV